MHILPFHLYHEVCFNISGRISLLNDPKISEVPLGALGRTVSGLHNYANFEPVACPASELCNVSGYQWVCTSCKTHDTMPGELTGAGWNRFNAAAVYNGFISVCLRADDFWLPQANHIFQRLNLNSQHEDYAFVHQVIFTLHIPAPTRPYPGGYLFACPAEHLRTDTASFALPRCPWFWSLDPSGISRLSRENAESLGFPMVQQNTDAFGRRWNTNVYDGLRTFHSAKGFDPYSQDLAKHLGCHLMELPGDKESLHAHVDVDDSLPEAEANDELDKDTKGAISQSSADSGHGGNRHRYW
ncbi:hypothetical protein FB45DRAFT_216645 [Roridomyces roridus]|uniref:Uncharacterized protein n=1 Tax=Roridomyces roridus TaxID=1738132 RepID=A0AAD7FDR5_9AGAR|nr:hypothetical protein FB45DRAFT_216645 [Roridomyces roridus]